MGCSVAQIRTLIRKYFQLAKRSMSLCLFVYRSHIPTVNFAGNDGTKVAFSLELIYIKS